MTAAACGSIGTDDGPAALPSVVQPTTERTVVEEIPTTTEPTTTTTRDTSPLPERDWPEQTLRLLPVTDVQFPTALTTRAGGDDLWLTERPGRVRQIQRRVALNDKTEGLRLMNTVVLDITDRVGTEGEGGLLGLAFSSNGRLLYVSYTDQFGANVIAEYEMGVLQARPETERVLLRVEQPFSNHNGGQIAMGLDGFLYIGIGDGGSQNDPDSNAQNNDNLLGTIVRIDPLGSDGDLPYGLPGDNPFVGTDDGRPEIWAWGLRNPWRFSFDADSGDLWVADVGQDRLEEVTVLPVTGSRAGRGANLGWDLFEGTVFRDNEAAAEDGPPPDHVPPLITYGHENNRCSITGGYVYRGDAIDALDGVYLFADFCSNEVFGVEWLEEGRFVVSELMLEDPVSQIVSFGEGPEGEIYVLEAGGRVSRLETPKPPRETVIVDSDEPFPGGAFEQEVGTNQDGRTEPEDGEDG